MADCTGHYVTAVALHELINTATSTVFSAEVLMLCDLALHNEEPMV